MNKIDKTCWSTQKSMQTSSTRINLLGWAWPKERRHHACVARSSALPNALVSTVYLVYTYMSEAKTYASTVLQSTIRNLIHSTPSLSSITRIPLYYRTPTKHFSELLLHAFSWITIVLNYGYVMIELKYFFASFHEF